MSLMKRYLVPKTGGHAIRTGHGTPTKHDKVQDRKIAALNNMIGNTERFLQAVLYTTATIATSPPVAVTQPTQGDGTSNRTGDIITYSGLNGVAFSEAADNSNFVRFMLFQWKADTAADVPSLAKLFQDPTVLPYMSAYIYNRMARKKFKVLVDKLIPTSLGGPANKMVRFNVPGKKMLPTDFSPAAVGGGNLIYYLAISDSGAVTPPTIGFTFMYKWVL